MYIVRMWQDYYNEKGEYREHQTYRDSKSMAIEMARWNVKHLDCDRALVFEPVSRKIVFFMEKIGGHMKEEGCSNR